MSSGAHWPETWDAETDVLVVGAGACGFAAALSAAERGCRVLLLEKWNKPGGNTALSSGFIPAAGTRLQREAGVEDSPELMAEDILRKNGYTGDPELTLHLCRASAGLVHWLMDTVGIELRLVTDFLYGGQSVYRFHAPPSRSGEELIAGFMAAVARQPLITLVTSTPVTGLITNETGAVVGVWAGGDPGQGGEAIRARKVILANNGFGGNAEMVRRYCPEIAGALYFGHPGNTGDGIRWGRELGAATRHMDAFQGHGSVAYPHGLLVTWAIMEKGGLLVNSLGRRF
ncbi:MAG TPA: FAD-dependent oxidoreductase, partial [Limnochordales bacterium]